MEHRPWRASRRRTSRWRGASTARRADPSSPYAGKYIGVWRGEVVAVADTLGEVVARLDTLPEPASWEAVWIEADVEYDQTYMIWEFWEL